MSELLTASSTFWLVVALLAVWVALRKRTRARAIRERWAAEEEELARAGPVGPTEE